MTEKEYIVFYSDKIISDVKSMLNIVNNVENDDLSKLDDKKIMGICRSIEKLSTLINNKTYDYYIYK